MSTSNTVRDESLKYYSMVAKLVRYTSKFGVNDDSGRQSKQNTPTRNRLSSSSDLADKSTEGKRFRLAPVWSEWNEIEINNELWDTGNLKKKETTSTRSRADTKTNNSTVVHIFEDPEGKIELPPSMKVEQWKRPIDFLPSDKPPLIVDPELGIQTFDLITSNEHLHCSEIMRNIISQITSLWDICQKERRNTNIPSENLNPSNIIERTWRPWEHIYALNKVSKQPFITPYNPAGKYAVRLFFLGAWRKIIIDDSIPFDSQNRCLLPQTTLSSELWPMLLTKALLKIISLDFNPSNDLFEYSETSVIHLLTGWIPESIPLKYTYAEKIWNFLRYDRSNKLAFENESSSGPVSLYKWPDPKIDRVEETTNQMEHLDDKSSKKTVVSINLPVAKEPRVIKSASVKENRTTGNSNPPTMKDVKKTAGTIRGGLTEDVGVILDDQTAPEAPKMIVLATISHLQSAHLSSYSETADRSERLRRYNLNETFSTSVLLTTIRDIPLEPPPLPPSSESIPAWKLIRPRKPKVLPHAEPIIPHQTKSERWIEIASPYINYPTASVLNIKPTIRPHSIDVQISTVPTSPIPTRRSKKSSSIPNPFSITEINEDENAENEKTKSPFTGELVRSMTSISLPATKKELNVIDIPVKSDESSRSAGTKSKRLMSVDKNKAHRRSTASARKISSDTVGTKTKGVENEQLLVPIDLLINNEQQLSSQLTDRNSLKKSNQLPKIWMDFDDFCACFTSVIVFHNPRAYQYNHKHTEIKFTPYQPPVPIPVTKEKKKESTQIFVQPIPNLQDDKSFLYLFVDSTRETLDKNIQLIISLTCLPRWYDAVINETIVSNEKPSRGTNISADKVLNDVNLAKLIVSQKEIDPQIGSLIAEIYSWKSLAIGQPILRLHTTATKAALLTLPPGRHVLKLTNTCPFAFNLQILSDTNDFMLGDKEQLLNKIISVPEDAEFIIRAEEFFSAFEDSIENFHCINQQKNKFYQLVRSYCQQAPNSIDLTVQICLNAFNQALYSTLRTVMNASGTPINPEIQFAWRCFTNDLVTPDILGAYEIKRPTATSATRHSARSSANKRSGGGREDKTKQSSISHSISISDVQEELISDWLVRELSIDEIDAINNIQKIARGFLQRRIDLARTSDTEKNLTIQRILQSTMSLLKVDSNKSALLLFKNFLSLKPQLIQCFSFHNDDWNMVTYRDYNGLYPEQSANTWFVLFREIFHITEESLIVAKFLSHLPNSLLRVINNDTYEEMPLVFNRLAPAIFTKNKNGYTFFAEGIPLDQPIPTGRFRLRLITSYAHLPEPRVDQLTSSFLTREILDYYLPNKEEIICRYRIIVAEDTNQTGRNFHLASIHFSTSKSDVHMRLTIFDHDHEIAGVEGKGSLVLPAILFMRTASNISRPTSKTGGSHKKSVSSLHQGSVGDLTATSKERIGSSRRGSRSSNRTCLSSSIDGEEKSHKYFLQVTLLRKSWPLTLSQWQFIEQEKNELKTMDRQLSPAKNERKNSNSTSSKRAGQTNGKGKGGSGKSNATSTGRSNTDKTPIDTSKPHWILRVVSDVDKVDELIIKKDNERNEELMNMKKAWETVEAGRAEKAMKTRQKFLDSLKPTVNPSETQTDTEIANAISPSIIEQEKMVKQTPARKKSQSVAKKGSIKEEPSRPTELILPQLQIDEPLLHEPPSSSKPELSLPPLDLKPFIKRKLSFNESILSDSLSEQEDFERRHQNFMEYLKHLNNIRQYREDDFHHRSKEKTRQLEEYVDLQGRIDRIRRLVSEPREAYRQRFLEIERQRLQILAAERQRLFEEEQIKAAAMIKPAKKKTSAGKKKKK